jgi:hypothetical protein
MFYLTESEIEFDFQSKNGIKRSEDEKLVLQFASFLCLLKTQEKLSDVLDALNSIKSELRI